MQTYRSYLILLLSLAFLGLAAIPAGAQYKKSTAIPPSVAAPDTIDAPFGTLHLTDGFPDTDLTQKLYDNLDFQCAVQAYLLGLPPVSQWANRKGMLAWGPPNTTVPIFETMMNAKTLELKANIAAVAAIARRARRLLAAHPGPVATGAPRGALAAAVAAAEADTAALFTLMRLELTHAGREHPHGDPEAA